MDVVSLLTLDQQFNWHPCAQMQEYEWFKPLLIKNAYDCYLELTDGKKIIDAISSWWCKSLGHNHPILKKALLKQVEQFEHVIFANTTHANIIELSQKLTTLMPHLKKVFYASDGSSAIEIAMKMSLHSRSLQQQKRYQFIALKNGYHGETLGALGVSDLGLYRQHYQVALLSPILIDVPYVPSTIDPLWFNAEDFWQKIAKQLQPYAESTTAIIFEPILQATAGMKIYSADFLKRLCEWAKAHDIHIIADEIMTGLGRTGKMLASEYADIQPDFICLAKGLTSGWLPFSAVLTSETIYSYFYDPVYQNGFLHSHTHSGNALAVSVALATLNFLEKENLCDRTQQLQSIMTNLMQEIADETGLLQNIRGIGAVVAAEIQMTAALPHRLSLMITKIASELGALLRPLGNTIYWTPPLIITDKVLMELKEITQETLLRVCKHS